jgi:paraquat-inducible protein B
VGYRLGNPADHVVILLTINNHYASLITPDTRFWNASGIDVDIGLFSGAKIHAESMESLLAGGIAFATPVAGTPPACQQCRRIA